MIQGIIFDVDGVLLDSMPIWMHIGEYYLKGKGIIPESNLGDILFEMSMEKGAKYLKDTYHLHESIDTIQIEINQLLIEFYEKSIPLKTGVFETLKSLHNRKIPMVIATSSDEDVIQKAFQRLHIDSYFEKIFTCTQIKAGKDKPDIYIEAAYYIQKVFYNEDIDYKDIYVVEDALYALQTAKQAGFIVIGMYDEASHTDWNTVCEQADIHAYKLSEKLFQ